MPDAYLFDIGNVIILFDFSKAARKIASHSASSAEEALPLVASMMEALEMGHLSPEDFIAAASEKIGFTGAPSFFREAFADIFELNLPMVAFIEARKAEGKMLYLLSNTNGIHVPFFESTFPIFALFDGRIYSHEVGRMKPDPAIYDMAQKRFSLIPDRTLYIDDLHANCEAGREAGYLTMQYSPAHHEDFLKAVVELGEG